VAPTRAATGVRLIHTASSAQPQRWLRTAPGAAHPSAPPGAALPLFRIGQGRGGCLGAAGTMGAVEQVVVAGCAGSGKSCLARELAARTGLPLIERDELGVLGSADYRSAIGQMAQEPRWILDGAPYYADEMVYAAADTVIFLEYAKPVVMWRVLRRTLRIELSRRPEGAHRPQGLAAWRDGGHPVRWAWISHRDRHREGLALSTRPELAGAQVIRLTRPIRTRQWLSLL
jgi:hypothetical protein